MPSTEEYRELHDLVHHECFLANSVRIEMNIEAAKYP